MRPSAASLSTGPDQIIRVLVADDAWELRRLVCDVFDRECDLAVVGEATHGREALDMAEALRPDVVLLDYLLPGVDSDSLVRGVYERAPGAAIVGFSGYDPEILAPAVRERLTCHVDKMCALNELAEAVRAAALARAAEPLGRREGAPLVRRPGRGPSGSAFAG